MEFIDLRPAKERAIEEQAKSRLGDDDERIAQKLSELQKYLSWSRTQDLASKLARQCESYWRTAKPEKKLAEEIEMMQYRTAAAEAKGVIEATLEVLREKHSTNIAETKDADKEIRRVGEFLEQNGGDERMRRIAYRVQALGGSVRELEHSWSGICGWRP